MGVPHFDLPDEKSALADASEWFDARTSCWHVRVHNIEEVLVSKPACRNGADGLLLNVATFKRWKLETLATLKAQSKP